MDLFTSRELSEVVEGFVARRAVKVEHSAQLNLLVLKNNNRLLFGVHPGPPFCSNPT